MQRHQTVYDLRIGKPFPARPVRRVVRRGHQSIVGYYPSWKMKRYIAYESPLERDYLILADTNPDVTEIFEQPEVIKWRDGATLRNHIPDFLIIERGQQEITEIKWLSEQAEFQARTDAVSRGQRLLGRSYRVLCEDLIRAEPELSNAKKLLMIGRRQAYLDNYDYLLLHAKLLGESKINIDQALAFLARSGASCATICAMILKGIIRIVDPKKPLNNSTAIQVTKL